MNFSGLYFEITNNLGFLHTMQKLRIFPNLEGSTDTAALALALAWELVSSELSSQHFGAEIAHSGEPCTREGSLVQHSSNIGWALVRIHPPFVSKCLT